MATEVRAASLAEQAATTAEARAEALEGDAQALGHFPDTQEAFSECVAILRDAAGSLRRRVPSGP